MRTTDYEIGVRQTGEAPDYITGRQDRTAWRKGPIETEGTLTFPFTLPFTQVGASTGAALFIGAANLAKFPNATFIIKSSAHPQVAGCKVQSATISCEAGAEVTARATVWGVIDAQEMADIHSYQPDENAPTRITWGSPADAGYISIGGIDTAGSPDGEDVPADTLVLEQIPLWDIISIVGAPTGMFITGMEITIENNLVRLYTMGTGSLGTDNSLYSPFGLNPTAIGANQRRITGTITWQSDAEGRISQILGAGINEMLIYIGPWLFTLNNVLWNANPPRLAVGDRVTVQSSFIALGTGLGQVGGAEFDALQITEVTFPRTS
mgnify:FL=1